MNEVMECPACHEIAFNNKPEPSTKDMFIQEFYCDACGHLECRENKDYDPSPDDQEDVTRIGGWG